MDLYSISSTYKINAKRFENISLQVKEAALWCVKLDIAMRTTRDEFIYRYNKLSVLESDYRMSCICHE